MKTLVIGAGNGAIEVTLKVRDHGYNSLVPGSKALQEDADKIWELLRGHIPTGTYDRLMVQLLDQEIKDETQVRKPTRVLEQAREFFAKRIH